MAEPVPGASSPAETAPVRATPRILRVTDLNRRVRGLLDADAVLADVWVEGEVSQPSFPASGHCFFTLKDGGSQVKAVLFREGLARASSTIRAAAPSIQSIDGTPQRHFMGGALQPAGLQRLRGQARLIESLGQGKTLSEEKRLEIAQGRLVEVLAEMDRTESMGLIDGPGIALLTPRFNVIQPWPRSGAPRGCRCSSRSRSISSQP